MSIVEISPSLGLSKTTLNEFIVEKKIGKGQFSSVYKAIRKADNTAIALKKVPVGVPTVHHVDF
jgi:hypothetical protein